MANLAPSEDKYFVTNTEGVDGINDLSKSEMLEKEEDDISNLYLLEEKC